METKTPTPLRIVVMVLFALSCFGLLLFLWISFGGSSPLAAKGYRFEVQLPAANNIAQQADVRISGVPVGKVVAIKRDGTHARVTLQIEPKYAPLPSDIRVALRRKTLLGETYIELTPGSKGAPRLKEGATLPASHAQQDVPLDQILNAFDPKTRQDLQTWFEGWGVGVKNRAPEISADFSHFAGVLDASNDLLGVMAQQKQALSNLIRDTGTTFATIGDRNSRVSQLITASDTAFRATASQARNLTGTFQALPGFFGALRGTLSATQRISRPLTPAFNELQPAAQLFKPTLDRALQLSPTLRSVANRLDPVLNAAPAGLSAAVKVIDATEPLLPRLRFLARYLVPIVGYAYEFRQEISATWPKGAAATNAVSIDPGTNQPMHYLRAPIVFPSEALTIATHRQPYSRANPYLAPNGLSKLLTGNLEAFDCRNTSNSLTVPAWPPGTAPKCITQGPITVDGKTASCPERTPAP